MTSTATATATCCSTTQAPRPTRSCKGDRSGFNVRSRYAINGSGYRPIAGDFDGKVVRHPLVPAREHHLTCYWFFAADRTLRDRPTSINGRYQVIVADFDANGLDDLFWDAPGSA